LTRHHSICGLYNDFFSDGGKLWPIVKEVAEQGGLIGNLKAVVTTAREKGIQVFIVSQTRLLQEAREGRELCDLGTTATSFRRCSRGLQIVTLGFFTREEEMRHA